MFSWQPPIGVYIGILAFLGVAVPWLRDKPSKREKAIWTACMFLLMWLELRSIYHDQAVHDREQAEARAEQLKSFREIAHGIDHAIADSQRQFAATMASEKLLMAQENRALLASTEAVNNITGGNSFCYMSFLPDSISKRGGRPLFSTSGKYPLYGVQVRISDLIKNQLLKGTTNFEAIIASDINIRLGDFTPQGAMIKPNLIIPFSPGDSQKFNLFFNSDRNGFWTENIRMMRVADHWSTALRTFRDVGKQIKVMNTVVDKDYPRTDGKIAW